MAVSAPEVVEIKGQFYFMNQIPDEKSAVVLSEQQCMCMTQIIRAIKKVYTSVLNTQET